MPKLCEQCGNYDPTRGLTTDSRCPCCGLVYASLSRRSQARPAAASPSAGQRPDVGWPPVRPSDMWLGLVAAWLLFAVILADDDGFILLLDHANLAFHEAGHLIFGLLGATPGLYGGTLGQLVFPIVAGASFHQRRHAVGLALSGVWLFENLLNIARYMADARAQVLPLVGGGEHDWYLIFSRHGWLEHDTGIAAATQSLGWLGMIGCLFWLWRHAAGSAGRA